MNALYPTAALCLAVLLAAGCASKPADPDDFTLCENPRPEVCTMEYRPVCAYFDNRDSKTYASGCTACADSRVSGHRPGEC